ncbi:predicetd ATPase [Thermococcus kodakarensis KOD1]|uniref:Predicetd ATPase n=1 Tax=Thermococcus kodakarensis (strain ATCC BAA-918 / JCM 12380 / KOD1) TaxID=69014 RepID=Q5JDI3_THEKO|nr:ATPase, T2SS/T4P/T4SS family [Thermococcus kodakarensis]WCN27499.1 ATPase, T2SS/T4P/T4SS family [Thermococcus kodakarensis]WCN29789.1 ATPase, T2SS/T4P/T4SS family [Thermococcus kodakarensis]BAD85738.1 predicetd ATPase [Thermococcus kodakarensis KOD1]
MGVYIFTPEDLVRYGSARPEQLEVLREAVLEKKDILIVGTSRSGKTKLVEALLHYVPDEWKIAVITAYGEFKPFRPNIEVVDTEFDRRSTDVRTSEVIEKIRRINPDYVVIDTVHTVDVATILKTLIDDYAFIVTSLALTDDIKGEVMHWLRIDEDTFNRFDVVVELARDWRTGLRKINRIYKVKDGELIQIL